MTPAYRIFVRAIKFGAIGLTSHNSCFKLSSDSTHRTVSVNIVKQFIKDDKELSEAFKKSRDKANDVYRIIDLYNKKHSVFNLTTIK